MPDEFLDPSSSHLADLAKKLAPEYKRAEPFPHVVIDDFLQIERLAPILKQFPPVDHPSWYGYENRRESLKLGIEDETIVPAPHRALLREINSHIFVDFLEKLTGLSGLIPDPHFRGGGLHQMLPGGFMLVHSDFNINRRLNLVRRVNVLLYLNDSWEEGYGADLELWDARMSRCVKRIAPISNRLVIFSSGDDTNHGVPSPLSSPAGISRRSMVWYFWGADPLTDYHTTAFKSRPGEQVFPFRERAEKTLGPIVAKALPRSVKDFSRRFMNLK